MEMITNFTPKQKRRIYRVLLSAALFLPTFFVTNSYVKFAFCLISFILCGQPVIVRAVKNIGNGNFLDEHFLMTVASVGALCIGEWTEGVAVMLFYQVGELFESVAVSKSRKSISALMDISPGHANVVRGGEVVTLSPHEVQIGETLVIKPGERVPVDCRVTEGASDIDTKAITGEPVPVPAKAGDHLLSGSVNISGALYAVAENSFQNSAAQKILELVEHTSQRKTRYESFIHRFSLVYTPVVVCCAIALAVIPTLFLGNFTEWLRRALMFLVVSCPCALVISVPLTFFGGLGKASSQGILVKGSGFLETLSACRVVAFDKTGTLTTGTFSVTDVLPKGMEPERLLKVAASAEQFSNHPISQAVRNAWEGELFSAENVQELAGRGVSARVDGRDVLVGNQALMEEKGIPFSPMDSAGTVIYIAENGVFSGCIALKDQVKAHAKTAISQLYRMGIKRTVMLTGDKKAVAKAVMEDVGLTGYHAELLPQDKVACLERMLQAEREKVVFVGDGINDAPVLAMADVSVAMGALGSDAAIEAADIVLTDDNLLKIPVAIRVARKTVAIAKQNIVFAIGVKLLVLVLSAVGVANMWVAVFADVGVAMLAILNAVRVLKMKI